MKADSIHAITRPGVLVIARLASTAGLDEAVVATVRGGARAFEVTLNTPGAVDWIGSAAGRWTGQISLGVGTVRSVHQAQAAIEAGADFLVCPHFNEAIVGVAAAAGVPAIPGAFTPTEVSNAVAAGAELVKLFPADIGGPGYLASLTATIDDVALVATGGVTTTTAGAYVAAGATAVAIGASVINDEVVSRRSFDDVEKAVRATVTSVSVERMRLGPHHLVS